MSNPRASPLKGFAIFNHALYEFMHCRDDHGFMCHQSTGNICSQVMAPGKQPISCRTQQPSTITHLGNSDLWNGFTIIPVVPHREVLKVRYNIATVIWSLMRNVGRMFRILSNSVGYFRSMHCLSNMSTIWNGRGTKNGLKSRIKQKSLYYPDFRAEFDFEIKIPEWFVLGNASNQRTFRFQSKIGHFSEICTHDSRLKLDILTYFYCQPSFSKRQRNFYN